MTSLHDRTAGSHLLAEGERLRFDRFVERVPPGRPGLAVVCGMTQDDVIRTAQEVRDLMARLRSAPPEP